MTTPNATKPNPPHLSRIHASAIDCRARNPIFRRTQLKRLHDTVASHSEALERAIRADALVPAHVTPADARLEICLALRAVRELAAGLDIKTAFAKEYSVASSRDADDARRPVGIVVVEPAVHTPVYSAVASVAAAVAGGNCVILQLDKTLQETPSALREALHNAVDHDTIALATADEIHAASFGETKVVHFIQQHHQQQRSITLTKQNQPSHQLLQCPSTHRTVAIVERDADLDAAALTLVGARFAFGGTSPYAPDIVLVNEWAEKAFLEAVLRHTATVMAGRAAAATTTASTSSDGHKPSPHTATGRPSLLDKIKEEGKVRIVSSGDLGTVLTIQARDSFFLSSSTHLPQNQQQQQQQPNSNKITGPIMAIHAVTSMDDAIDTAGTDLLAAYVFTKSPANAQYLTHLVDSAVAFVNDVPTRLLVGPAAPLGHPINLRRGGVFPTPDMFTVSRPVFVERRHDDDDGIVTRVVRGGDAGAAVMSEMGREMGWEMAAVARPLKQVRINFFQQGLLTSAVLIFGSVLTGVGIAGYHGYRLFASRSR